MESPQPPFILEQGAPLRRLLILVDRRIALAGLSDSSRSVFKDLLVADGYPSCVSSVLTLCIGRELTSRIAAVTAK
jgi:hypothetical protein